MSFQPEERYWTDYLRIALPAIGLVLLVVVFWYWAGALIGGDDDGGAGEGTQVALVDVPDIDASPTAPTSSPVPSVAPSPGPPPPTEAATTTRPTSVPPTPTEESAPATDSTRVPTDRLFSVDSTVITTGDVNLRSEPTSGDNIIEVLPEGTQLRITGSFVDAGAGLDYDWYPVEVLESGETGFVNEEFVTEADG